ncbi:MAG TPA: helix-turn-helix transcriptional regulator [Bacteroidales bacterium]|nr:helix-turn-helix transcriptional regulator [Bacteroidales bacterium]
MSEDIVSIVRREVENKRITFAEMARRLGISRPSVTKFMSLHDMSVNRLMEISKILEFNFFREIAANFSYNAPLDQEKEELKEHVKSLEFEIKILRQTIKDMS